MSLASDRLCKVAVFPARAFMINARLAMLLDAGNSDAVPLRTVVRLSRIIEFNNPFELRAAKYVLCEIFLNAMQHLSHLAG